MTLSARILVAADDVLQASLDGARRTTAAVTALWWPKTKNDLEGHACHCALGAPLHLVHSEGLREGANVVVDYGSNIGSPYRHQVPVKALARIAHAITPGDIIHVKSELLGDFVRHVLPGVTSPFVLVTGDFHYSPVAAHRHLLGDSRVIHWFAQNCDIAGRHPKLTRIPIGMDNPRYTKIEKRVGFLVEMMLGKSPPDPSFSRNDMGDQKQLQQIAAGARGDIRAKPARALCTFHMNQKIAPDFSGVPDRREAYEALKCSPDCHFVPHRLLQEECWEIHRDFAFEISPRGKGLDCFRTWEALFLGVIPIVKSTTLDPLYRDEDFPVVIVDSYREVTVDNLRRWKDALQSRFTPQMYARLTNDYWLSKICAAAAPYRVLSGAVRGTPLE